jgi:excisionase family DNA binding protein
MAKLTKVQAARQLGISRTTLYKLIDQGKVSATADGCIDETELVRAAPYVDTLREHARTRVDTVDSAAMDTHTDGDGHEDRVHEHVRTHGHEQAWTGVDTLVDILREQLQRAQERERAYEERERAMQDHIAQLTAMLHESQQQNQRLLDMPRPAPQVSPQDAPGATPSRIRVQSTRLSPKPPQSQPEAQGGDPRGDMRRRIMALLQEHPEGLTPAEIRTLLSVEKSLADTCLGMLRYGLVQRVGRGRYVAAEPSRHDRS